jgi:hypothetical protein
LLGTLIITPPKKELECPFAERRPLPSLAFPYSRLKLSLQTEARNKAIRETQINRNIRIP